MEFFKWIETQGGIAALSKKLNLGLQTAYAWKYGRASPTSALMIRLVKLSKGKLSYADIIDATQKRKAAATRKRK